MKTGAKLRNVGRAAKNQVGGAPAEQFPPARKNSLFHGRRASADEVTSRGRSSIFRGFPVAAAPSSEKTSAPPQQTLPHNLELRYVALGRRGRHHEIRSRAEVRRAEFGDVESRSNQFIKFGLLFAGGIC